MNDQEIGARFGALANGTEPEPSMALRRFVREHGFLEVAPARIDRRPTRPMKYSRLAAGIAAALIIGAGAVGAWASLHGPVVSASPSPSRTATPTPYVLPATASDQPSPEPTATASFPTPSGSFPVIPEQTLGPWLKPSSVSIGNGATVTPTHRTGADKAYTLRWDFTEPLVTTPGSSAGARIGADVKALADARLADLKKTYLSDLQPLRATLIFTTRYTVIAWARSQADPGNGFVTIRNDYVWVNPPWADSPPQWIDFLSYDLRTGKRISVSDLFTNTDTALKRLDAAASADPTISSWFDPQYQTVTGHEPTPKNYAEWAPTRSGFQTDFGWLQLGSAVSGTPAFTVSWDKLRDLIKPDSYLGWYIASLADQAPTAPQPGTFGLTGSMVTSETAPSAVLLKDGRVLVIGGATQPYDPATGVFSATEPVPAGLTGETVTLLDNGKVLLAGGDVQQQTLNTALIYDPATGKFAAAGNMDAWRANATATLLKNGRVLIVGGLAAFGSTNPDSTSNPASVLASAEIYDPATGRFTATGSMSVPRTDHTATLLADGRVLIVGGNTNGGEYSAGPAVASAEIYDPATGEFSETGALPSSAPTRARRSCRTAGSLSREGPLRATCG